MTTSAASAIKVDALIRRHGYQYDDAKDFRSHLFTHNQSFTRQDLRAQGYNYVMDDPEHDVMHGETKLSDAYYVSGDTGRVLLYIDDVDAIISAFDDGPITHAVQSAYDRISRDDETLTFCDTGHEVNIEYPQPAGPEVPVAASTHHPKP